MKRFDQQWSQLTTLARQAGEDRGCAAPYGFATRVSAQAMSQATVSPWAVLERFALRGLFAAAACSLAAVAFAYTSASTETIDEYTGSETVVELLGLS